MGKLGKWGMRHTFRLDITEQSALDGNASFRGILNTQTAGLVHLTKPGNNSLALSLLAGGGIVII
jgi:hypothetical protein